MLPGCCDIAALCDRCLDAMFAHLRGVAANRGDRWAGDLALQRRAAWVPWPADSEKIREHAIRRIADLSRDVRLRELLATEAIRYAAKRWDGFEPSSIATT